MSYNYVIMRHAARVELYFAGAGKERNKAVFDALLSERQTIEDTFGDELKWERLDEKQACRISKALSTGGYHDEDQWSTIQDEMIAAMIRFDEALRPAIAKLKSSGI